MYVKHLVVINDQYSVTHSCVKLLVVVNDQYSVTESCQHDHVTACARVIANSDNASTLCLVLDVTVHPHMKHPLQNVMQWQTCL